MNYGINDGHTITGPGSGAVGRIKEGDHTRLVGEEVRRLIEQRGHKAINCTVDYANTTSDSLSLVVQQANRQYLDWFIAIHFNAGNGKGVEVYTYEGRQYDDAVAVCNNIAELGFRNRGVKAGTGLYVIRKTKAKSMLIEVCFVDTEDADHYLNIGYKAIAKAIVDGLILNANIEVPQLPDSKPVINTSDWIKRLQEECNNQGFSNQIVDGIAGKNTLKGCPTLKIGSEGNITKLLQERIGVNIDGVFGVNTRGAITEVQKNNGLSTDGVVGKNTWRALLNK